jgi:FkbH-like protein
MSEDFLVKLGWLPRPPHDFRLHLSQLGSFETARNLRLLASTALDSNQLNALARRLQKYSAAGAGLDGLTGFNIGIVSSTTTELILPSIVGTGLRFGLAVDAVSAPFGQMAQVCAGLTPAFNDKTLDAVLLMPDIRHLPSSVEAALEQLQEMRAGIARNWGVPCIVQNLVPFPEALYGSLDSMIAGSNRKFCLDFNAGLALQIQNSSDVQFDAAGLAANIGNARWHDPVMFNQAKLPFAQDLVPLYSDHICRLLAAMRGKNRRCLVVDLDNTLWGGVIGDDGLDGIVLGQGDALGEAFIDIQRTLLALRDRGIVLAVCSKNDDTVAREPFRQHPEMLLREEHITVFQANWQDKASNIRAIADALQLGLQSLVFLDDNPVERDLVRSYLPEVAVPELPIEPALFTRALLSAGYFDTVYMSEEDRLRVADYQANARRVAIREQAADMDSYLQKLNMCADIRPFDEVGIKRITQLINKSNQFNLTTRRYTEPEVRAFLADPAYHTWQIRLRDSFSDNGMISVLICKKDIDAWDIDTWLMSCRVLGRRLEELVLRELVKVARTHGVAKIRGMYLATERNSIVKEHYKTLGFRQTGSSGQDSTWELEVASYTEPELPFMTADSGLN